MAIEAWALNQRQAENDPAADLADVLREHYGDIPLTSVDTALEQLVVPTPPQELIDTVTRAKELGVTVFDAVFLTAKELSQDTEFAGWNVKPGDWYWNQIKRGTIAKDAARLPGAWVLVDRTPKPNYDGGKQLYEDDPFGPLLKGLREEGRIQVPSGYEHVPATSRFAISADELEQAVFPEIAKFLGVEGIAEVRKPKGIEFNVLGNLRYPQLGETDTWEWFDDKFGGDRRLVGGDSDVGGLASVDRFWSGYHYDFVGFRPLIVFPS